MKPSNPLDLLIEESRKARDQAGRTLAEDRTSQKQAALQLDTLLHYKREYHDKLHDALMRGVGTSILDNYRRFIRSLDHAIADAGCHLQQHDDRVDASKQDWRSKQRQLSSYDTLASRRAARARARAVYLEQRQTDELTNNHQARQRTRSH